MKFTHVVATLLLVSAASVGGYGYFASSKPVSSPTVVTQPSPVVAPPQQVVTPPAEVPKPKLAAEPAIVTEQSPAFINGEFNLDNIKLITPSTLAQKVSAILENTSDEELGTGVGQALLIGRIRKLDEDIYAPILFAIEKQYLDIVAQLSALKKKEEGLKTRREYESLIVEVEVLRRLSESRRKVAHEAFIQGNCRDMSATYKEVETKINSRLSAVSKQQSEKYDAQLKELGELEARRWGVYNNAKVKVKEILEMLKTDSNNIELKIQLADAEQAQLLAWEGPEGVQVIRNERNRVGQEKGAPGKLLMDARKAILDTLKPMVSDKTYIKTAEKVNAANDEVKKYFEQVLVKRNALPKE